MVCEHCWDRRLEKVPPEIWGKVLRYLKWEPFKAIRSTIYSKGERHVTEVPDTLEYGDYGRRIREVVNTMLAVEDDLNQARDVCEIVGGFDETFPQEYERRYGVHE